MASRKPIAQSLVSGFSAYIDPEVHPTAFLFHGPLRTTPGSLHHSDTFPCMPNKPQGLVVSQRQPAAPGRGRKYQNTEKSLLGNRRQQKANRCFTRYR